MNWTTIEFWYYQLICLAGSFGFIILKWIKDRSDAALAKEPFFVIRYMEDQLPHVLANLVWGFLFLLIAFENWPPITTWKAVVIGLLGGTAAYNLFPLVTSPELWKMILDQIKKRIGISKT